MTPNWIRFVCAAACAAVLLPAQEEHEVIVRKQQRAKAAVKAKKEAHMHAKMKAIIEQLADEEASSESRKKAKQALLKLLDRAGRDTEYEVHVISEKKPLLLKKAKANAKAKAKPRVWNVEIGALDGEVEGLENVVGELKAVIADQGDLIAKLRKLDGDRRTWKKGKGKQSSGGSWVRFDKEELEKARRAQRIARDAQKKLHGHKSQVDSTHPRKIKAMLEKLKATDGKGRFFIDAKIDDDDHHGDEHGGKRPLVWVACPEEGDEAEHGDVKAVELRWVQSGESHGKGEKPSFAWVACPEEGDEAEHGRGLGVWLPPLRADGKASVEFGFVPHEECEECEEEECEECEECEEREEHEEHEECEECDEHDEHADDLEEGLKEVVEMVEEMRAEMRELRKMMREIRAMLRGHGGRHGEVHDLSFPGNAKAKARRVRRARAVR